MISVSTRSNTVSACISVKTALTGFTCVRKIIATAKTIAKIIIQRELLVIFISISLHTGHANLIIKQRERTNCPLTVYCLLSTDYWQLSAQSFIQPIKKSFFLWLDGCPQALG